MKEVTTNKQACLNPASETEMTDNTIYNIYDLPDESMYTDTNINGVEATFATIVDDKIRKAKDLKRAESETVVDTTGTATLVPSCVQDADVTYSVANKIKLRNTENNVDHPNQFEVEESKDTLPFQSED